MRSSSSGFLLLLLGAIGLIGFLTGNLDRWLAYLFSAGTAPAVLVGPPPGTPAVDLQGGNRRAGGVA